MMLLAGNLGGTKTLLGSFEPAAPRPVLNEAREFATPEFDSLADMLDAFLRVSGSGRVDAVAVGVAGPIINRSAQLTNVGWDVTAAEIERATGSGRVSLLNDVEAMGYAIDVLEPSELSVIQAGRPARDGHAALVTVGTGLGQAFLHRASGRWVPHPSEGGHADFAARTDDEVAVLRALRTRFGRVDVERVVSGPGLANIASVVHDGRCPEMPSDLDEYDVPRLVSEQARSGKCAICRQAVDLFVAALGSVCGNLALQGVARAGLYIGGGVAAKNVDIIASARFLDSFRSKPPMEPMLAEVPVTVITNSRAGLLGAAVHAARLARPGDTS